MARKAIVDGGAPNGQTTMKDYTPVGEARKGELIDGRYVYDTLTEKAGSILNDAKTGVQNAANTVATAAKNGAATLSDYISNARAQLEQVREALTEKKEDLEAAKEESGNYADKQNLGKQIEETDRKLEQSKAKGRALMEQKEAEDEQARQDLERQAAYDASLKGKATKAAASAQAKLRDTINKVTGTTQPIMADLLDRAKTNTKQADSFKYDPTVGDYIPKSYQMIDGIRKSAGDTLTAAQNFIDKILKGEKDIPFGEKTFKTAAEASKFIASAMKKGDNDIAKEKSLQLAKQKAADDDEDKKKLDAEPLAKSKAKAMSLIQQKDAEDEQAKLDRERQEEYDNSAKGKATKAIYSGIANVRDTAASVKKSLEDTYYNTRYKLTGKARPYDSTRYDAPKETKKEALARVENSKAKGRALMEQKEAEDARDYENIKAKKKAAQSQVDNSKNKAKALLEELTGLTAEEKAEKERYDNMNREALEAIERNAERPYDPLGEYSSVEEKEYTKAKAKENLPETLANIFQRGGMESSVVNALLTSGALDDDDFDERTIETIYNSLPNEYIAAIEDLLGNKLKKHSAESTEELLDMLAAIGEEVIEHGDLDYICHYGVKGQVHGQRRWQNPDGTLTPEGREHYGVGEAREPKESDESDKRFAGLDDIIERGFGDSLKVTGKRHLGKNATRVYTKQDLKDLLRKRQDEVDEIDMLAVESIRQRIRMMEHSDTDYILHSGIPGQRWGERNGPPYPLSRQNKHSEIEKGALFVRDTYNNTRVHQLTKSNPDATKTNLVNKGNNQQEKSNDPKAQKIDTAQKIAQYAGAANAVASGLTNTYSQYLSLANARKRKDYEAVYTGDLDTTLARELDTAQAKMMAAAADENAKKSAYESSRDSDDEGKRTKAEAAYAKAKAARVEAEKAYSEAIDAANHRGSSYLRRYDDTLKTVDEHIRTEGPKPKTDTQTKIMGGLQAATAISGLALTVGQFLNLLKQNK